MLEFFVNATLTSRAGKEPTSQIQYLCGSERFIRDPCASAPWRFAHGRRDYRSNVEVLRLIMPEPLRARDSHLQTMASVASVRRSPEEKQNRRARYLQVRNKTSTEEKIQARIFAQNARIPVIFTEKKNTFYYLLTCSPRQSWGISWLFARPWSNFNHFSSPLMLTTSEIFAYEGTIYIHACFDYSNRRADYVTTIVRTWMMGFAQRRGLGCENNIDVLIVC